MIELTEQQRRELHQSKEPQVRVLDPDTGQEFFLVSSQAFERLRHLLTEANDWTPEEGLRLLAESGQRAGWDDPSMDVYDNYDESRKRLCP